MKWRLKSSRNKYYAGIEYGALRECEDMGLATTFDSPEETEARRAYLEKIYGRDYEPEEVSTLSERR